MAPKAQALARPLLATDDLDYEAAFRALAEVHSEMRRDGVSTQLLLRRGLARFALGNYLAAAFDAERVARQEPDSMDAHYLKGQACVAMAAVRAGLAHPGIGVYMPSEALPERSHLLAVAQRSFEVVLRSDPDDRQARRGLATVNEWQQQDEADRLWSPLAP